MAGHSKFKNIMHRKGAQDKKRAAIHGRIIREITVAVRMAGPEPDANPRLRLALSSARAANMGKDVISRAVKRGAGDNEGETYEEVRYEGYGPGGVAVIVEALTDNRNRTAASVRAAFNKYGGSLGAEGSVAHAFGRVAAITYSVEVAPAEAMFEAALDAGAMDVLSSDEGHDIIGVVGEMEVLRATLEERFGEPSSAGIVWRPQHYIDLSASALESLEKLLDLLSEDADVRAVFSNES